MWWTWKWYGVFMHSSERHDPEILFLFLVHCFTRIWLNLDLKFDLFVSVQWFDQSDQSVSNRYLHLVWKYHRRKWKVLHVDVDLFNLIKMNSPSLKWSVVMSQHRKIGNRQSSTSNIVTQSQRNWEIFFNTLSLCDDVYVYKSQISIKYHVSASVLYISIDDHKIL